MNETYAAHNSLDDVKALQKLSGLVSSKFPEYVFGPSVILNSANVAAFKATLLPLQKGKFISQSMAAKIARGGLNHNHLKSAYERHGYDCLSAILGVKVNRTVCVTKHGPVIQKIFEYFSQT